MAERLRIFKVADLPVPSELVGDALYLTLTPDTQAFNMHITDIAGTRAIPLNASAGGEEGVDQFMLMGAGINV